MWPTPTATKSNEREKEEVIVWGWRPLLHPLSEPSLGLTAQRPDMADSKTPEESADHLCRVRHLDDFCIPQG